MILRFKIIYDTRYGENLLLNICDDSPDGSCNIIQTIEMRTADGHQWVCDINTDSPDFPSSCRHDESISLSYHYSVRQQSAVIRREWTHFQHRFSLAEANCHDVVISDKWHSYFFTSPFTNCWHRRRHPDHRRPIEIGDEQICVVVAAPALASSQRLFLIGETDSLGRWNTAKAVAITPMTGGLWYAVISRASIISGGATHADGCEVKFIVKQKDRSAAVVWQEGHNQKLTFQPSADRQSAIIDLGIAHFPMPRPRFAGTIIPLFSLRSEGSCGIGDFGDLKAMVDWAVKTHQSMLQLLPINDTVSAHTWQDSYPYNPVSVFALHTQYIDLRQLPPVKDLSLAEQFEQQRQRLNSLPTVDYPEVNALKSSYLAAICRQEGRRISKKKDYLQFIENGKHWLPSYVAYCQKRDNGIFTSEYYLITQYIADRQMREAHDYARKHGIALKGDIPIGVNPEGCDVEQHPEYFNTDYQTGAPPDAFAAEGQNWRFPTYNWEAMRSNGYEWWKKRLQSMAHYFDAFRIDHILGFFRIWEIPKASGRAAEGQFSPAIAYPEESISSLFSSEEIAFLFLKDHRAAAFYHPRIDAQSSEHFKKLSSERQKAFLSLYDDHFFRRSLPLWRNEAMTKLPALTDATSMMACGEDLGMIPDCVAEVMVANEILSLEIETMPKQSGQTFTHLGSNRYCSVTTFATHDMPTMRGWWKQETARARIYYNNVLEIEGNPPRNLPADVAEKIVARQLQTPSMLTLLTLQDWLSIDEEIRSDDVEAEQINIPADPNHKWRYRMHITLEQLLNADRLNSSIARLIDDNRSNGSRK